MSMSCPAYPGPCLAYDVTGIINVTCLALGARLLPNGTELVHVYKPCKLMHA